MTRSIQQLPNNSGTASTTEVYTATGFNAGDPVYFQNGDYKKPSNLTPPSSLSFGFTETAAVNPNGGGGLISPAFSYAQMQTSIAGGSNRRFADVLTSGNIVQVFANYNVATANAGRPYFRIVNSSGTVVTGPTLISSTIYSSSYSSIAVVALIGGGFAVSWLNSTGGTANSLNYAIYDNTGTVVTAVTQDTSFALSGNQYAIEMVSLANGGFAVAAKSGGSGTIYLRSYGSTGTGAYSIVNTTIAQWSSTASFALAARSDNSVFVCDRLDSTQYQYALYNSSGVAIVSPTIFTINSTQQNGGPDATVLANGTTIVIAFYNNNGSYSYPALRFLPTGNVLSAQTTAIPIANLFYQTTYGGNYIGIKALSSDNIALVFADGYGNMQYAFYNSSGTCISGSNSAGAIPLQIPGGFCGSGNRVTLIESSGSVYAYWTNTQTTNKPVQQYQLKISTSTYLPIPLSSITGSTYTVSGQTTGALIPSTVNPNSASYYTPTTAVSVATNTPATVSTTQIASINVDSLSNCSLTNGNFVVVYRNSSSYAVTANVYSPSGSLITSINVGTGYAGGTWTAEVTPLSGGGFVLAYLSASTIMTLQSYSSAYGLTTSTTFTMGSNPGTSQNFDMAGLPNNQFVIIYYSGAGYCFIDVYSSTLTVLATFTGSSYSINQGFCIAANSYGGFSWTGFTGTYGYYFQYTYVPTGVNTWAQSGLVGHGQCSAYIQNPQMVSTPSGLYVFTGYQSSYPSYMMMHDTGAADVPYTAALSSWPLGSGSNPTSYPMMALGLTGNGNVVMATAYSSTNLGIACLPAQMTFSTGQPLPYSITGTSNVPMFSKNGYAASGIVPSLDAILRISPLAGNNFVITYRNNNSYPAFQIVNGTSFSVTYTVTGNSTPSNLVPVAPVSNSGANVVGVLAGVALTNATAGSTGQLAINGQVQLGSSYTSTATGAFDHTGQAVSGVKGTFNGRSVNLQGNS